MHLMQPTREPSTPDALPLADFEELLGATQRQLFGFARGLMGDTEQARDIVQEVYADAWRATCAAQPPFAVGHLQEERRRWLFRAAYWRASTLLRRRRIITWESLDESDTPVAETYYVPTPFEDRVAEGEVLRAALASLSPADTACLLLGVVQGYTSAEIAQVVQIAPSAAKKRLSRAKQRLRAAYFAEERAMREQASS